MQLKQQGIPEYKDIEVQSIIAKTSLTFESRAAVQIDVVQGLQKCNVLKMHLGNCKHQWTIVNVSKKYNLMTCYVVQRGATSEVSFEVVISKCQSFL